MLLISFVCLHDALPIFYYRPTTIHAYQDIKDLTYAVTLGGLLRNMHRWAAHLMVVAVILHMLRVFFTAAYKPPREYNWVIGVLLLVMTLFLSYTGYLLPWDQLALWAVTVGAQMAASHPGIGAEGPFKLPFITTGNDMRFGLIGGTVIGDATLIRFYVLHCVAVPFLFVIFLAVHLWRVRKDSFSKQTGEKVDVWPHLISREFLAAVLVTVILLVWSILMPAPLEEMANINVTPNPSKAPWYFVGLQELLVYFDPWLAGVGLPGIIMMGLMAIPYIDTNPKGVGNWPKIEWRRAGFIKYPYPVERPFAVSIFTLGVILWFGLIFIGYYCRGPNWEWYMPWEEWSHRRISKLTVKNLPNLWGLTLLGAYGALQLPFPKAVRAKLAEKLGAQTPDRLWTLFHIGIGMVMAVAMILPLIISADAEYPFRSKYPTLFESLGHAPNAPVVSALYNLVQQSPALGYAAIAAVILALGGFLGWVAVKMIPFKDKMFEDLGPIKYVIVMQLLLMMFAVLGKAALRLLFGIKYVISFPSFNFNI